jgi:hypothetical protein
MTPTTLMTEININIHPILEERLGDGVIRERTLMHDVLAARHRILQPNDHQDTAERFKHPHQVTGFGSSPMTLGIHAVGADFWTSVVTKDDHSRVEIIRQ